MRSGRTFVAVTCLVSCATPLPRPTSPAAPTLAGVLAPEVPRPELARALAGLLGGDRSDVLLPLGDDTVRCVPLLEPGRARLGCDAVVEEAPDAASLVKKVHTGELQRRVVEAYLRDGVTFQDRTGLRPLPRVDPSPWPDGIAWHLGDELGPVRFEVGERGEVVRASFAGLAGEETIEARSLVALGQRLAERRAALPRERRMQWLRGQLERVFAERRHLDAGGWEIGGLPVGSLVADSPRLRGLTPLDTNSDPQTQVWPQRWLRRWTPGVWSEAHGVPFHQNLQVEAFDGRIQRVQSVSFWRPHPPYDEPLDCDALDAWLSELGPAFERRSEARAAWCEWGWREGEHRLHLWLEAGNATLGVIWRPDQYEALRAEAERVLEQRELARQRREHEEACQRCPRLTLGHHPRHPFTVTAIDRHDCTATIRPDDGTAAGAIPCP